MQSVIPRPLRNLQGEPALSVIGDSVPLRTVVGITRIAGVVYVNWRGCDRNLTVRLQRTVLTKPKARDLGRWGWVN